MQPFLLSLWKRIFPVTLAVCMIAGCSAAADSHETIADPSETIYEYNGIRKTKSELSADTVRWLEWYQSLPEEQQDALSFVPSEFTSERTSTPTAETSEAFISALTETPVTSAARTPSSEYAGPSQDESTSKETEPPGYLEALSDYDRYETEELVRYYYSELFEETGGVEVIEPAPDDFFWYQNKGIEAEYTPGNIIIYHVLTTDDRLLGNGYRSVSIARRSKSDEWKIINSGY